MTVQANRVNMKQHYQPNKSKILHQPEEEESIKEANVRTEGWSHQQNENLWFFMPGAFSSGHDVAYNHRTRSVPKKCSFILHKITLSISFKRSKLTQKYQNISWFQIWKKKQHNLSNDHLLFDLIQAKKLIFIAFLCWCLLPRHIGIS